MPEGGRRFRLTSESGESGRSAQAPNRIETLNGPDHSGRVKMVHRGQFHQASSEY
jgi:hypothetical protein